VIRPARLAEVSLNLAGWRFEGAVPPERKYVAIAAPHTSNWDGLLLILLTRSIGLDMRWMIKDDWTKGLRGAPIRKLGAVAINRSRATNIVDQMVAEFERNDDFVLFVPPEGTRARADYWKSGFYHIARGANVPVIPAFLDYRRKRGGFGPALHVTGDIRADMETIRAFYKEKDPRGRVPGNFGPIRLREEDRVE
jgi:1-acyl-sn-glycerol-3-phosphate acyltransferase